MIGALRAAPKSKNARMPARLPLTKRRTMRPRAVPIAVLPKPPPSSSAVIQRLCSRPTPPGRTPRTWCATRAGATQGRSLAKAPKVKPENIAWCDIGEIVRASRVRSVDSRITLWQARVGATKMRASADRLTKTKSRLPKTDRTPPSRYMCSVESSLHVSWPSSQPRYAKLSAAIAATRTAPMTTPRTGLGPSSRQISGAPMAWFHELGWRTGSAGMAAPALGSIDKVDLGWVSGQAGRVSVTASFS